MDEEKLLASLAHYDSEEQKSCLGGMAWDEVCWNANDLIEKHGWKHNDLARKFPNLFNKIEV
jgi:hypothetical protein